MFTVIICSKKIIDDCNVTYNSFLRPLIETGNWAFCEWNPEGDSLKEAVPNLERTVAKHRKWRAVIVNDNSVSPFEILIKTNPFDVVGAFKRNERFDNVDEVRTFRERKEAIYSTAVNNPITKLTSWLLGAAENTEPEIGSDQIGFPEFPALPADTDARMDAIYENGKRLDEILLNEIERINARRYEVMHEYFKDAPQVYNKPTEAVLVSERIVERDNGIENKPQTEFEYSEFYTDNMYPHSLRYMIYDLKYVSMDRDSQEYFNFLTFLLAYAGNEHPRDALKPERVYRAKAELDTEKISELCHRYLFKLQETRNHIDLYAQKLDNQKKEKIDNATAVRLFESDVHVPVEIDVEFNDTDLMTQYDQIGMAKDVPGDEETYWDEQHREIRKNFTRYLREPRRAVRTSVSEDFREMGFIDDNRVLRLSDNQKEDVALRLLEEEENMVKSAYSQVNNANKHNAKLDEADKEIRKYIGQRMTMKMTVRVTIAGTIAFIMGFVPWIVEAIRFNDGLGRIITIGSFILGTLACLLVSFLMVLKFKRGLINLLKHFNKVMNSCLTEIEMDLVMVARYLSHACNVMREFSVLNAIDSNSLSKRQAMDLHKENISARISRVYDLFYNYIDDELVQQHASRIGNGEAYEFDFTKFQSYEFEIPYAKGDRKITFMEPGYTAEVPVDYLKEITLEREELYE